MAEKDYLVISPIKHGGKRHEPGATVTMEVTIAGPFVPAWLQEKPAIVVHSAPADEVERRAAIAQAIGKLDISDASLWMKSGAPRTEAIEAVTGWPVKAADRDAVWAEVKAEAKGE